MSKGFRLWDSVSINEALKVLIQIKHKIEDISYSAKTSPDMLPPSIVPTEELYNIAACYEAMYKMLLDRDLVETGNLKSPKKRNNLN